MVPEVLLGVPLSSVLSLLFHWYVTIYLEKTVINKSFIMRPESKISHFSH